MSWRLRAGPFPTGAGGPGSALGPSRPRSPGPDPAAPRAGLNVAEAPDGAASVPTVCFPPPRQAQVRARHLGCSSPPGTEACPPHTAPDRGPRGIWRVGVWARSSRPMGMAVMQHAPCAASAPIEGQQQQSAMQQATCPGPGGPRSCRAAAAPHLRWARPDAGGSGNSVPTMSRPITFEDGRLARRRSDPLACPARGRACLLPAPVLLHAGRRGLCPLRRH